LHAAGAKVIVDDVIYLAEPMFQDGIVAQAVDQVAARGTAYFSAAGNDGRRSYERRFRNSRQSFDYGFGPAAAHDFDPGPGVDVGQRITVPELGCGLFVLQWAQPFRSVSGAPGSATDFDILLLDPEHTIAYAASLDRNRRSDPVEILEFCNDLGSGETVFDLVITRFAGDSADRMKYVYAGDVTLEERPRRDGTVYGHANAAGAEAVGAADYLETPAFGRVPAGLEPFSSAGGVRILFDGEGWPLATPVLRRKPGVVAPDGINTTFFGADREDDEDGFPNFFGTLAAAPHAAAIAALILQANRTCSRKPCTNACAPRRTTWGPWASTSSPVSASSTPSARSPPPHRRSAPARSPPSRARARARSSSAPRDRTSSSRGAVMTRFTAAVGTTSCVAAAMTRCSARAARTDCSAGPATTGSMAARAETD
jgi:hypothetical protein